MARIVVIEDEADLRGILDYNLRQAGHTVQTASSASEGLRMCRERAPDLVLLDLMLPDLPGTEAAKQLRAASGTKTTPILMLTAKGEEIDRVLGFELGADDYVTKPFSMRELLLRVQALLRRGREEPDAAEVVEFGKLKIDKAAHRAWVEAKEIELTAIEFKLLVVLHERRNRVQTRDTLLEEVWGIQADVTTRTVDTHVKRLRDKLGPAADYVETVRGAGYRFADSPGTET